MELMKKHVDLDRLEVLYEMPFEQAALERDFDVRGGCWTLQDGTLIGANRENNPGMIISRQDFFGPVMLDFEARTILPCTTSIVCGAGAGIMKRTPAHLPTSLVWRVGGTVRSDLKNHRNTG